MSFAKIKMVILFLSFFSWFVVYGQEDSILNNIEEKLPENWKITLNKNILTVFTDDSIGAIGFNPILYDSSETTNQGISRRLTPLISYSRFDVLNIHKLDSTLKRIDALKSIIRDDYDDCHFDPSFYIFTQHMRRRGEKRAARRAKKKENKRESQCYTYDDAEIELRRLLSQTPTYFSEKHAFGTPYMNWLDNLHKDWIIRIGPSKMEQEIATILNLLNNNLSSKPLSKSQ